MAMWLWKAEGGEIAKLKLYLYVVLVQYISTWELPFIICHDFIVLHTAATLDTKLLQAKHDILHNALMIDPY